MQRGLLCRVGTVEIRSRTGIGPIRLGMTREEVRRVLGVPYKSFMKTPFSRVPTDAFDEILVHVYYNLSDRCEAVEVFDPGTATFLGEELVGRPFELVLAWMRALDPDLEVDADGLRSRELGLGLYAPGNNEETGLPVEAVIVFVDGYYEQGVS